MLWCYMLYVIVLSRVMMLARAMMLSCVTMLFSVMVLAHVMVFEGREVKHARRTQSRPKGPPARNWALARGALDFKFTMYMFDQFAICLTKVDQFALCEQPQMGE